jgi:hypothetical protein
MSLCRRCSWVRQRVRQLTELKSGKGGIGGIDRLFGDGGCAEAITDGRTSDAARGSTAEATLFSGLRILYSAIVVAVIRAHSRELFAAL